MSQLPANFRSLYRLFLRTTSAAVLHHPGATKNLRLRWRPWFTAGANVTKEIEEIEGGVPDTSPKFRDPRYTWLKEYHNRVDNTLQLLYNASLSRGIPHRLLRNLAYLTGNERQRVILATISMMKKWKPQDSYPQTPKPLTVKEIKSATSKREEDAFKRNAAGALAEVVRMAEAAGKLTLGSNAVKLNRRWLREGRPRKLQ